MGIESSDEMASFLGGQYLIYKEIRSLDEILNKYEVLKKEDVTELFPFLAKEKRYQFHIE
ncbi:hypothetical protein IJU97_06170 [bacterium]|nr:hypothetical protein [bacterium]